jgi:hypothetical protein
MGRAMALTDKDIADIKGMLDRGDRQQDIAAWFGENAGRVGEIRRCDDPSYDNVALSVRARSIGPSPFSELPPEGPYVVVPEIFLTRMDRLLRDLRWRRLGADE